MSFPVWLHGPMFLPGGLYAWSNVPSAGSLFMGVSVWGLSARGSLSRRGLCPGIPLHTVKSGRHASYWNAFLFLLKFGMAIFEL